MNKHYKVEAQASKQAVEELVRSSDLRLEREMERVAASIAATEDLSLVGLDLGLYEAFASGFIPSVRDFVTEAELESLALGALTLTFELVARFLEDYLNGDRYFKVHHPEHNLQRAKSQLTLALDMKEKMDQMQAINRRYFKA